MPERIQLSRAKGWRMPPNTVGVARTRSLGWGNPFRIGSPGVPDATAAVEAFRLHLIELLTGPSANSMAEALTELRGKNLACWCKLGEPCHADVLLEFANQEAQSNG